MGKVAVVLATALLISFIPWLSFAQTGARHAAVPVAPAPIVDDLAAARSATDTFLKGIKIADLPEGEEMLRDTQWITGEADVGLYERPTFTEDTTVFEKLFDTDVPGVQGYKRLLEMTAASEARTPLLVRYLMIAYEDRNTKKWKILFTGTGDRIAIDRRVSESGQLLHYAGNSEQFSYMYYGLWLLLAGQIKESRQALTTSLSAKTTYTSFGTPTEDSRNTAHLQLLKARSLLGVIESVTGQNTGSTEHP